TDASSAADVTPIDTQDLQTKSENQPDAVVAVADSGSAPAEVHVSDTVSARNDSSLDEPTKGEELAAVEEPAPKSELATIPDVVVQDQPANDSKEPLESNADTQESETNVAVETDAVQGDKLVEHEGAKDNGPTTTEDAAVICKTENPLALEESPAEAVPDDEPVSEQSAVDLLPSKDQPSALLASATDESALEQPAAKDTIDASVVADDTPPALDSTINEDSVAQSPAEETKTDVLDAAVAEPGVVEIPNADAPAKVVVDEERTVEPTPEVESVVAGPPDEHLDADSAIVNPQTDDLPLDANGSATAEPSVEESTEEDKPVATDADATKEDVVEPSIAVEEKRDLAAAVTDEPSVEAETSLDADVKELANVDSTPAQPLVADEPATEVPDKVESAVEDENPTP
ncbi:hypothetical protein LPJ72_006358, partial [Coemansia sp. Benny D160-2]